MEKQIEKIPSELTFNMDPGELRMEIGGI